MPRKKMEPTYLTPVDVAMRLANSIVSYKKKFFFAKANGMELKLYNRRTGETDHIVSANSKDLDVRSPELGYVNFDWGPNNKQTWFVYRVPYRKQKQGIAQDNLAAVSHLDDKHKMFSSEYLMCNDFENMLEGIYPSFQDVMKSKKTFAFSRNYAVVVRDKVTNLAYNGNIIGEYNPDLQSFKLNDAFNNSVTVMKLAPMGVSLH